MQILRLGFVVVSAGLVAVNLSQVVQSRQTNVDLVAEMLESSADQDDYIVVDPWWLGVSFNRYYQGTMPWVTLPDIDDHRTHRYDLIKERMVEAEPIEPVLSEVAETLQSGQGVWVLRRRTPLAKPPQRLPPAPLGASGWSDSSYTENWSLQLAHLIRTQARVVIRVPVPVDGPVNPYENYNLYLAEGWR